MGKKKETKVNNKDGEIAIQSISVNALPLIKLNNNSWDKINSTLEGYSVDENGNLVFSNGYIAYCNKRCVLNVVFNEKYTGKVVGDIRVGTDLKTIEKNLGTPTFKTEDYIGYKTKTLYVFFYEKEISIYPNRVVSNKELETMINDYSTKRISDDRARFLANIRNNYEDFLVELDEENDIVTITSALRQLKVKLDNNGAIEVEFYNGYKYYLDETKEYVENNRYKTNEEDLVEIVENERNGVR